MCIYIYIYLYIIYWFIYTPLCPIFDACWRCRTTCRLPSCTFSLAPQVPPVGSKSLDWDMSGDTKRKVAGLVAGEMQVTKGVTWTHGTFRDGKKVGNMYDMWVVFLMWGVGVLYSSTGVGFLGPPEVRSGIIRFYMSKAFVRVSNDLAKPQASYDPNAAQERLERLYALLGSGSQELLIARYVRDWIAWQKVDCEILWVLKPSFALVDP